MEHAWCRDVTRDEAVRAAEDGRTGPLPTLWEAIAAPFACTACGGFGMDHRCRESCEECDGSGRAIIPKSGSASSAVEHENKGDGMATKAEILAYYRAEAIVRPFADSAERSSTVSKTGEGQSGMRTERVVLSLKHMGELIEERDAAIRERDTLRAERITQALTADRFAAAVMEADTLRARVAELESAAKLAPRENDDGGSNHAAQAASGGGEQPRGWLTGHERRMLKSALSTCRVEAKHSYRSGDERAADGYADEAAAIESLLARSTPPEVVLPTVFSISLIGDRLLVEQQVRQALAAAGVAVKEVG